MNKLFVDNLEGQNCSNCGISIEEGYIIFSEKGNKNTLICKDCDGKEKNQKKISITVKEVNSMGYSLIQLFNNKYSKMYQVIKSKNINYIDYISEEQLKDYMNNSNIDVNIIFER